MNPTSDVKGFLTSFQIAFGSTLQTLKSTLSNAHKQVASFQRVSRQLTKIINSREQEKYGRIMQIAGVKKCDQSKEKKMTFCLLSSTLLRVMIINSSENRLSSSGGNL